MALLAMCFASSTFIFPVLLFRGVLAPFTHSRGSKDAKLWTEAERLARPGRNGSRAGVTQTFRGAKRASGERRPKAYSPGRGNLTAAKRGERHKMSVKSESSESRSEGAVS